VGDGRHEGSFLPNRSKMVSLKYVSLVKIILTIGLYIEDSPDPTQEIIERKVIVLATYCRNVSLVYDRTGHEGIKPGVMREHLALTILA
jgi:hypothetical protein